MTAIKINGINYTNTRPGYYYKAENGKQVRIPKAEWDAAYVEYEKAAEAEAQARKAKEEADAKAVEKAVNAKEKKPAKKRKPKDVAYEGNGVTLTAKQVDFIRHLPDTNFWEDGLDSTIWTDILADEIGGQFEGKPMTTGAMISTICEKGLAVRGKDKVNGKKATAMALTDLGKKVAAELGLE